MEEASGEALHGKTQLGKGVGGQVRVGYCTGEVAMRCSAVRAVQCSTGVYSRPSFGDTTGQKEGERNDRVEPDMSVFVLEGTSSQVCLSQITTKQSVPRPLRSSSSQQLSSCDFKGMFCDVKKVWGSSPRKPSGRATDGPGPPVSLSGDQHMLLGEERPELRCCHPCSQKRTRVRSDRLWPVPATVHAGGRFSKRRNIIEARQPLPRKKKPTPTAPHHHPAVERGRGGKKKTGQDDSIKGSKPMSPQQKIL